MTQSEETSQEQPKSEKRKRKFRKGPQTPRMREASQRGGKATRDNHDSSYYSTIGQKGGEVSAHRRRVKKLDISLS